MSKILKRKANQSKIYRKGKICLKIDLIFERLFLIDIPFSFRNQLLNEKFNDKIIHPLLLSSNNEIINSELLDQRIKLFHGKKLFWQLGSKRQNDFKGIIKENILSKQMVLTLNMLIGGTPIILYGQEIGQNQVTTFDFNLLRQRENVVFR